MSHKYTVEVWGIMEVRADLKRLALLKTLEEINKNYQKASIDKVELEILTTADNYTGYYEVEYDFKTIIYTDSEHNIERMIHKNDNFNIISVE